MVIWICFNFSTHLTAAAPTAVQGVPKKSRFLSHSTNIWQNKCHLSQNNIKTYPTQNIFKHNEEKNEMPVKNYMVINFIKMYQIFYFGPVEDLCDQPNVFASCILQSCWRMRKRRQRIQGRQGRQGTQRTQRTKGTQGTQRTKGAQGETGEPGVTGLAGLIWPTVFKRWSHWDQSKKG